MSTNEKTRFLFAKDSEYNGGIQTWGDYRRRKQDLMRRAEEEMMNSYGTESLSRWRQSAGKWGGAEGPPPGRGAAVLGEACPPGGERDLKEPRHLSPSEQSSSGLTADTRVV